MKIICMLDDELVLGTPGRSQAEPRHTSRAIVMDRDGRIAMMYAEKFRLYSLPGGGVEPGENPLTALHREIREETGCACGSVRELGIVEENRGCYDYTQINHYYVVTAGAVGCMELTEMERANGTRLLWLEPREAYERIRDQKADTPQQKYLRARDLAAMEEFFRN